LLTSHKKIIVFFLPFLIISGFPNLSFCESELFDTVAKQTLKELRILSSLPISIKTVDGFHQVYSKLYNNDTLRISIFLGMMNTANNICLDRPTKHALVEYLTQDCQSDSFACGFFKKSNEPTILQKKTDDSKNIIISIHDSSVSESVNKNTVDLVSEQQQKSKTITDLFLKAIEEDDIICYIGHARYGTGPGFYNLPFLSAQWLSTYIRSPLRSAMVSKLNQASKHPKIFGLFSCNTERYYAKEIHAVVPDMALIVSSGITTHYSNVMEAIGFLNSILGNVYPSELNTTFKKLNTNSKYKIYGLFENNIFPKFKKHNSLLSVTMFLLILPIIILSTSKLFLIQTFSPFETKSFFKDLMFLLIFSAYSMMTIKYFSKFNNVIDKQAIPLFFISVGVLLTAMFLYKKDINLNDIVLSFKTLIAPLFISMLIYFGLNLYPTAGYDELFMSIIQSAKLLIISATILPFFVFTTGILKYPLFVEKKIYIGIRIILFIIVSGIFCIAISYLIVQFNIFFFMHKIFILLFYTQLVSLLFYYYKSNTLLPIAFQTLTVAIILSENIHGLFY